MSDVFAPPNVDERRRLHWVAVAVGLGVAMAALAGLGLAANDIGYAGDAAQFVTTILRFTGPRVAVVATCTACAYAGRTASPPGLFLPGIVAMVSAVPCIVAALVAGVLVCIARDLPLVGFALFFPSDAGTAAVTAVAHAVLVGLLWGLVRRRVPEHPAVAVGAGLVAGLLVARAGAIPAGLLAVYTARLDFLGS